MCDNTDHETDRLHGGRARVKAILVTSLPTHAMYALATRLFHARAILFRLYQGLIARLYLKGFIQRLFKGFIRLT
jgi:hypothetical protein